MNYEQDIRIDPDSLDVEWLGQAELALKWAKHLTSLRKEVNQMEERKKTIRSELILEVNEDPEKLIGKKTPNANDIEAFYRTDKDYKQTVKKLLDLQEELEFAELIFQEIAWTRKKALENLVILHGQQYFAGPSVPRNLSEEWKEKQQRNKDIDSEIGSKMKRSKRRE